MLAAVYEWATSRGNLTRTSWTVRLNRSLNGLQQGRRQWAGLLVRYRGRIWYLVWSNVGQIRVVFGMVVRGEVELNMYVHVHGTEIAGTGKTCRDFHAA